jgi:hypothetical protein
MTAAWLAISATEAAAWGGSGWVGGHVTAGVQDVGGDRVGTTPSELEVDGRWASGEVLLRVDLDWHLAPAWLGEPGWSPAPADPPPPEYAAAQIGRGPGTFVRLGVVAPQYGYEEFDPGDNAFATYSEGWSLTGTSVLGLSPGVRTADGLEMGGFLGYDTTWRTPTLGPVPSFDGERVGTWSGACWFPELRYGEVVLAGSAYPSGATEVALELLGGRAGEGWLGGGQAIGSVGGSRLGAALRVERRYAEPAAEEVTGVESARTAVSVALRARPVDPLGLRLEGKETWSARGEPTFTATLLVTASTGDPPSELE